jgi:Flp pilus assembly protein TadG
MRSRGDGSDRGNSTVQTLMWATLLFTVALLGVQAVTYGWAYLAARHAADRAVQTARLEGATAAAGQAQAEQVLDQAAGGTLLSPQVQVTRDPQTATATVTGLPVQVPLVSLLPLPAVQVSVSAPVERFRPATEAAP